MTLFECPLNKLAQKKPKQLFFCGDFVMSYQDFENYVWQLVELLEFPKGSVIISSVQDPVFNVALLLACLRTQIIFFPVNFRAPKEQLRKYQVDVKTSLHFDKSVPFQKKEIHFKPKPVKYDLNQIATYLLTSGSGSHPKVCIHTLSQHLASARACNEHIPYTTSGCWLLNMPLYHVSGISLIFRTLLAEAKLEVLKSKESKIKHSTHISCVNTQLRRFLKGKMLSKKIKVILLGGASPNPQLLKQAKAKALPVYLTYGLTELASQVATSKVPYGSLQILKHINIKIDSHYQITLRGKSLFSGYLENSCAKQLLNQGGFFETSDLGCCDDKNLHILGRKDHLFISGGENIQPEEIERTLLEYPHINEAIVVGVPDKEFDHIPVAFIKTQDNFELSQLIAYLKSTLAKFKIPKKFLPLKYETLKPQRKLILENYLRGRVNDFH